MTVPILILKVAGRYITLPGHNNYPGKSMAANIVSQVAKLGVNVIEFKGLDDKDPRVKIIKDHYLESLEKAAKKVSKFERTDVWRTFIEVTDTDSKDPDKPFWIEVCGFRMPNDNNPCWLEEEGGYQSWGQAADAGGSLVNYALQHNGFIPNNVPGIWLDPSWGNVSPYITDEDKRFYTDEDEDFLELLETANEFFEDWLEKLEESLEEED